jgi:hypothetical protein
LAKRTLWRAIERMENSCEGKGVVAVKEDLLMARQFTQSSFPEA